MSRSFHEELVLNQFMLSFFDGGSLHTLKSCLGEDSRRIADLGYRRYSKTGGYSDPLVAGLYRPFL